jgi:hypothetical protein
VQSSRAGDGRSSAPLSTTRTSARLLYLTRSSGCGFAEEDLHLIAGLSIIGGLAMDRLCAFEDLEEENRALRQTATLAHDPQSQD